jgi:hypothetical protein
MKRVSRRMRIAVGISVLACVSAGVSYSYFSASGSGTAPATVGTSSTLTLHGTIPTTLYPGTSSAVNFTVDNPAAGHQLLGTISLASIVACNVAFVSGACPATHEVTGCESVDPGGVADANASDFYMANVVANQQFASGNGQTVTATGTLTMNDLSSTQDVCKNVNLLLNLTS